MVHPVWLFDQVSILQMTVYTRVVKGILCVLFVGWQDLMRKLSLLVQCALFNG